MGRLGIHREASDMEKTITHQLDGIEKANPSGHNSEAERYIIRSQRYTKTPNRLDTSAQKETNTRQQKDKHQRMKQIGIGIGANPRPKNSATEPDADADEKNDEKTDQRPDLVLSIESPRLCCWVSAGAGVTASKTAAMEVVTEASWLCERGEEGFLNSGVCSSSS